MSNSQLRSNKCNFVQIVRWWRKLYSWNSENWKMKTLNLYCLLDSDYRKWLSHPYDSVKMFPAKHKSILYNAIFSPIEWEHQNIYYLILHQKSFQWISCGTWILYTTFKNNVFCHSHCNRFTIKRTQNFNCINAIIGTKVKMFE